MRTGTDLALRATKAMTQAVGKAMASLVVLECHLWLNLTDIRDAEKIAFLDSPVSPKGLFSPALDGFTERFTEAQKTSQVLPAYMPQFSNFFKLPQDSIHTAACEAGAASALAKVGAWASTATPNG